MATIVNERDVLLQAATPRINTLLLPPNISVPNVQVLGVTISASDRFFRMNADGNAINASITLQALLPSFLSGNVTWSVEGVGTPPPAAGTTNTWTIYNTDQTGESATYVATLVAGGITYRDSVQINRIRNGLTGERGQAGVAGSLHGYGKQYGIVSSVWSDGIANRIIWNMLKGETGTTTLSTTTHLILGDTVTLSDGVGWSMTKFYNGFGSWIILDMVIDGNLLVKGTVSADRLTTGDIATGANANALIRIGNKNMLGSITSPFLVTKVSAQSGQTLIAAMNDKDDSVAIWGSTVAQVGGNAVAGTVHLTSADVDATRWQAIGLLGSRLFNGAVAGVAYGLDAGGVFRFYTGANSSDAGVLSNSAVFANAANAAELTGAVRLQSTASPIYLNGSAGTSGQVLTSQGPGATPVWGSGGLTYASLKSVAATADSDFTVSSHIRTTGLYQPTSGKGLEMAYDAATNTGYVISYNRGTSAYTGLVINASSLTFGVGMATFEQNPVVQTLATSNNSTSAASTAYVVSRIAQDAPTKSGGGAFGTWGISITGSSSSCTGNAATASSASTVNNKKVVGGSGSGTSISTGLSNIEGFSAITIDPYTIHVVSISGGTVTVQFRQNGSAVGGQAYRWTATGT